MNSIALGKFLSKVFAKVADELYDNRNDCDAEDCECLTKVSFALENISDELLAFETLVLKDLSLLLLNKGTRSEDPWKNIVSEKEIESIETQLMGKGFDPDLASLRECLINNNKIKGIGPAKKKLLLEKIEEIKTHYSNAIDVDALTRTLGA